MTKATDPLSSAPTAKEVRLLQKPELLKARLQEAPTTPGVYLFRGPAGDVIYVGKAINLRNRLRSYFTSIDSHQPRTRRLVDSIFDFETIAASNEQAALILENTLIKRYRPRFNVRLKDDKNYLYFRLPRPKPQPEGVVPTDMRERLATFPRPTFSRQLGKEHDPDRYFGPYSDAKALRHSLREVRTVFPFRGCSDGIFRRSLVCLDYHLGICAGPCENLISPQDYTQMLDEVSAFMGGRTEPVTKRLTQEMEQASDKLEFEHAAAIRDRLRTVQKLTHEQIANSRQKGDIDVIGQAIEGNQGVAAILLVRDGRLQGMEHHLLEGVSEVAPEDVLGSFVSQYYANSTHIPRVLYLPLPLPDSELISQFLSSRRHTQVEIHRPQRGRFRTLVEQAQATALASLKQTKIAQDFDADKTKQALSDLQTQLHLTQPLHRIECYDISNTMGQQSVGSMVVFEDGKPKPQAYRIFSIKTVEGPNDFASIEEVLTRRLTHLTNEDKDQSFGTRPDLLIIDGGMGQLASAGKALEALQLTDIPHFGLAKRFEELYPPHSFTPVILPQGSPALFLVQRIRDEAHRFAITHHRAKRAKAQIKSRLDEITGLGPARKRALLRKFGSLDGIRQASLEELAVTPGISHMLATTIKEIL